MTNDITTYTVSTSTASWSYGFTYVKTWAYLHHYDEQMDELVYHNVYSHMSSVGPA